MPAFLTRFAQRLKPVWSLVLVQLALWTTLRVVLYAVFRDASAGVVQFLRVVATGALFDAAVSLTALLPLIFLISVLRLRWLGRPRVRHTLFAIAFFVLTFDVFVQFFFFEEYDARYNHLALDYLVYPDEVFGNILASYNVPLFLAISAVLAVGLAWWNARRPPPVFEPWGWRDRLRGAAATAILATLVWNVWPVAPLSAGMSTRVSGEFALNGWAELVRAFFTSHLDYEAYYAMVPPEDAGARVARLVGRPAGAAGLERHFTPRGRTAGPPLDVVIVMEESLGSVFSARFGGAAADPLTPQLDRWSAEGLALTNLIANGNRTVRGMEGILCSFLPLPGDAIIKRDRSENVACLARILAARGYETTFFTGGYGLFDNVKTFMTANGYQHVVEQPDYPEDAFRTVWGVADEVVFDEMIRRQKAANAAGRRWLGTVITGSNHKPFEVPPGRVQWDGDRAGRRGSVRYADWSVGRYLTQAKAEGLLEHTVMLVVGDHGARVYGAEEIPVASYRVPALFVTPDPAYRGVVIDRLASQVDLAPTLLSLAGIEYDAPFFGRDLLGLPDEGGRAFVNHNRKIGLLTDTNLVVLGLQRTLTFYRRSGRESDAFTEVPGDAPALRELAADAEAAFQTAYRVYREREYRLPE